VIQFSDLGLDQTILKTLEHEGYSTPTPIQAKAIPALLEGADLLGIAQTGTGKTAAFALPILHHLAKNKKPAPQKGCRVLVLSPTRELASQIAQSFRNYGKNLNLSVAIVFGGVAARPQIRSLSQGVDILIATPGRLQDHIRQGVANLRDAEILVLDEADQMLDMGFVKPIRQIVSGLPKNRQTLFFSATMPREIKRLSQEFLSDPVEVTVTPVSSAAERVDQRVIFIETQKKRSLLTELLGNEDLKHTMIFTRTKRGADRVALHLEANGIESGVIHGNKSQRQREQALNAFRNANIRVLVATDIAARGIDVDNVSHVINFDLPETPEAYVHRIGRTARAGATGSAISLCDGGERKLLRAIERLTKQAIDSVDRRNDDELAIDIKIKTPRRVDPRRKPARDRSERSEPRRRQRSTGQPSGHRSNTRADPQAAEREERLESNGKPRNSRRRKPKTARNDALRAAGDASFSSANDNNERQNNKRHGEGAKSRNGQADGTNANGKKRTGAKPGEAKHGDGRKPKFAGQKRGGPKTGGNAKNRNQKGGRPNNRKPARAKSA